MTITWSTEKVFDPYANRQMPHDVSEALMVMGSERGYGNDCYWSYHVDTAEDEAVDYQNDEDRLVNKWFRENGCTPGENFLIVRSW